MGEMKELSRQIEVKVEEILTTDLLPVMERVAGTIEQTQTLLVSYDQRLKHLEAQLGKEKTETQKG